MDRQRGVGANEMGIWNDEERLGDSYDEIKTLTGRQRRYNEDNVTLGK